MLCIDAVTEVCGSLVQPGGKEGSLAICSAQGRKHQGIYAKEK